MPLKWKSIAVWPEGTVSTPNNESEDTHEEYLQATAVCKLLSLEGFGGMRKIFPISTRVERIFESLPSYTALKEWAFDNNFKFICGLFGNNKAGCLLTAIYLMENPLVSKENTINADTVFNWAASQFGFRNAKAIYSGFDAFEADEDNQTKFFMYGFNARKFLLKQG